MAIRMKAEVEATLEVLWDIERQRRLTIAIHRDPVVRAVLGDKAVEVEVAARQSARTAAFDTGADDLLRRAEAAVKEHGDAELRRVMHALTVTVDDLRHGGDASAPFEASHYISRHGETKYLERQTAEKARIKRQIDDILRIGATEKAYDVVFKIDSVES